ncbi:hypothetical protein U1Q18_005190, partial [Sarracenia purpurea var. burkii]
TVTGGRGTLSPVSCVCEREEHFQLRLLHWSRQYLRNGEGEKELRVSSNMGVKSHWNRGRFSPLAPTLAAGIHFCRR